MEEIFSEQRDPTNEGEEVDYSQQRTTTSQTSTGLTNEKNSMGQLSRSERIQLPVVPEHTSTDVTLIIVGHGSTENPDSSEPTHLHADVIRSQKIFYEVRCAFWKEEPSLREILYGITTPKVVIVPNFISEGYFTKKVIPRELELEEAVTKKGNQTIFYADPVGSHPWMTEVILTRAAEIAPEIAPKKTTLFIVGHGTALNENSAKAAKDQVFNISSLNAYGEVLPAYMEEAPLISDWDQLASYDQVIVVPFFISDGLHSYQDIPVLLGIEQEVGPAASQREIFRQNPYHLRGKTLYYTSAIGTEPMIAKVIIDQAIAALKKTVSSLK